MRRAVERWRSRLRGLVRPDESPWRVALALAVGVFISFTPFYGLQTVLSVLVATVFRLNTAAAVAGTWINLPWFAPFIYAGALKLGAILLPDLHGWTGMSLALLVGTTILGAVAAVLTYIIAFGVITARRKRRERGDGRGDRRAA